MKFLLGILTAQASLDQPHSKVEIVDLTCLGDWRVQVPMLLVTQQTFNFSKSTIETL